MGDASTHRADTYAYVGAFFGALSSAGVATVCVSPGSRSTPLAVVAAATEGIEVVPILDERSAGFFALGCARQSGRPVGLVCTSGTAASNYLPAVTECRHAGVPLIVLTADRPPELREWGAGQTIDQARLYGADVPFCEVPVASEGVALAQARALAHRCVDDSLAAPGPVHLNWPFREPLDPPPAWKPEASASRMGPVVTRSALAPTESDLEELADLARSGRGLIVPGPLVPDGDRNEAIARLAERTGWPVLADVTSGLRRGPHTRARPVLAHADLWLRDLEAVSDLGPDVVLRFGDTPVSKPFRLFIEATKPEHLVLVEPTRRFADPSHLATRVVRADPTRLAQALADRLEGPADPGWTARWMRADAAAAAALDRADADSKELDEARATRALAARLPDGATLFLSNSMPVRDADAFLPIDPAALRVLCNRGANGIDGVTSSALGAAHVGPGPVVLLTGDVALLHDLAGLSTGRTAEVDLVIVVLNNDGGGIFSFLPIAAHGEAVEFQRLFRTPHGADFSGLAPLFGFAHRRVATLADYTAAVEQALAEYAGGGVRIIEVTIDGNRHVDRFRGLAGLAAAAAAESLT